MEELDDFFNFSGEPSKKINLEGTETGGIAIMTEEYLREMEEGDRTSYATTLEAGFDYVKYYREKEAEEDLMMENNVDKPKEALDDITSLGDMVTTMELMEDNFYHEKYSFKHKYEMNLPIKNEKEKILDTIESTVITVIQGPTGCGKTTQVPQWILEEHLNNRRFCNIVVTQPRRIAAISIAKRVCDENDFTLGTLVGYQVALDAKTSHETKLTYMTTGVLLQKLVTTRSLEKYTHIILDEVHERNQDMDFLFIVVRKLLKKIKGVKVILMSATFNTERFSTYFSQDNEISPAIVVQNKNQYNIQIFYLGTLSILGMLPEINPSEPKISKEMYEFTLKTITAFENIDKVEEDPYARPSVLVFLPGIYEIEQLYNILNDHALRTQIAPENADLKWSLIPLHSTITIEEQVRAFKPPPPGHRKIILATNIAESSITVPDVKYVIDFCLSKVLMSNKETNFSSLQLSWASKANCKQRAGRTGRVRDGRVYRMVPQEFYNSFPDDCIPELQRCPLDNLVLSAKLLDMGTPINILALAMDPPDLSDVGRTILNLKQIGGLLKTVNGVYEEQNGDITFIGRIMAKLPLDTRVSKLIVLGYVFGCLEECIIIAGAMSVRNVFSTPFQERMKAYTTKISWTDGSCSDCVALLGVYKAYKYLYNQNYFQTCSYGERGWAKRLFLQINAIHEMDTLIKELKRRLASEEIVEDCRQGLWNEYEKPFVLKIVIAGAFFPFYFSFSRGGDSEEREAVKTLGGRDPRNTVYFSNMDHRQPAQLYAASIKDALKDCTKEDIIISYDGSGSKIYVSFPTQEGLIQRTGNERLAIIPGTVVLAVYRAIKMRQLRMPLTLNILPQDKAIEAATKLGIWPPKPFSEWDVSEIDTTGPGALNPRLPDIEENYVDIYITHVIDCGHFWSQYADDQSQKQLRWFESRLTKPETLSPIRGAPKFGVMYAAPYQELPNAPMAYYRAKVTNILQDGKVSIMYIDYGNGAVIKSNNLREIVGEHADHITSIRALAFECVLTEVSPSLAIDSRGLWSVSAVRWFTETTRRNKLLGKVYSVAHCIVSLELIINNESINECLCREGFAQRSEESYASKENRALRDTAENLQQSQKIALNRQQAKKLAAANTASVMYPAPNPKDCVRSITLKGPFSPLETKLHNLMYAGRNKSTSVRWDSVNSVILNADPQNPSERLLVASNIDQSSAGDNITLRNTTLLPNIPGLPAIISLIFCPEAELHPDLSLTKYGAVLCGLGHQNGKPLFPEHDILVPVDVDLTNEDLLRINKLRFLMDTLLLTEGTQLTPAYSEEFRMNTRVSLKNTVEELFILTQRKYRDAGSVRKPWQWSMSYPGMEVETENHYLNRAIFPPHGALMLKQLEFHILMKQAEDNQKLYQMCNSVLLSAGTNKVECKLCKTDLLTVTTMRIHLNSMMHKEREKELPQFDGRLFL